MLMRASVRVHRQMKDLQQAKVTGKSYLYMAVGRELAAKPKQHGGAVSIIILQHVGTACSIAPSYSSPPGSRSQQREKWP